MAIVRANQVVPMLTFRDSIVNKPCYYNLSSTFLLTIVNGFEDASTPTAIALDPIPVSALIRSGMAEEALRTDIP
jgi:hypothetical protein